MSLSLKKSLVPSLGGLFGKSDWPPSRDLKLLQTAAKSRVWILLIASEPLNEPLNLNLVMDKQGRY